MAALSPLAFLVAFLCFLFPFVEVSCPGMRKDFAGFELAAGVTVEGQALAGSPLLQFTVLVAFLGVIAGLAARTEHSLASQIGAAIGTILGLAGGASLLLFLAFAGAEARREAAGQLIEIRFLPAFWITILLFIAPAIALGAQVRMSKSVGYVVLAAVLLVATFGVVSAWKGPTAPRPRGGPAPATREKARQTAGSASVSVASSVPATPLPPPPVNALVEATGPAQSAGLSDEAWRDAVLDHCSGVSMALWRGLETWTRAERSGSVPLVAGIGCAATVTLDDFALMASADRCVLLEIWARLGIGGPCTAGARQAFGVREDPKWPYVEGNQMFDTDAVRRTGNTSCLSNWTQEEWDGLPSSLRSDLGSVLKAKGVDGPCAARW